MQKQLKAIHGDGGVIAITPDGQLAWSFNTPGMYRAKIAEGGEATVGIYSDETSSALLACPEICPELGNSDPL